MAEETKFYTVYREGGGKPIHVSEKVLAYDVASGEGQYRAAPAQQAEAVARQGGASYTSGIKEEMRQANFQPTQKNVRQNVQPAGYDTEAAMRVNMRSRQLMGVDLYDAAAMGNLPESARPTYERIAKEEGVAPFYGARPGTVEQEKTFGSSLIPITEREPSIVTPISGGAAPSKFRLAGNEEPAPGWSVYQKPTTQIGTRAFMIGAPSEAGSGVRMPAPVLYDVKETTTGVTTKTPFFLLPSGVEAGATQFKREGYPSVSVSKTTSPTEYSLPRSVVGGPPEYGIGTSTTAQWSVTAKPGEAPKTLGYIRPERKASDIPIEEKISKTMIIAGRAVEDLPVTGIWGYPSRVVDYLTGTKTPMSKSLRDVRLETSAGVQPLLAIEKSVPVLGWPAGYVARTIEQTVATPEILLKTPIAAAGVGAQFGAQILTGETRATSLGLSTSKTALKETLTNPEFYLTTGVFAGIGAASIRGAPKVGITKSVGAFEGTIAQASDVATRKPTGILDVAGKQIGEISYSVKPSPLEKVLGGKETTGKMGFEVKATGQVMQQGRTFVTDMFGKARGITSVFRVTEGKVGGKPIKIFQTAYGTKGTATATIPKELTVGKGLVETRPVTGKVSLSFAEGTIGGKKVAQLGYGVTTKAGTTMSPGGEPLLFTVTKGRTAPVRATPTSLVFGEPKPFESLTFLKIKEAPQPIKSAQAQRVTPKSGKPAKVPKPFTNIISSLVEERASAQATQIIIKSGYALPSKLSLGGGLITGKAGAVSKRGTSALEKTRAGQLVGIREGALTTQRAGTIEVVRGGALQGFKTNLPDLTKGGLPAKTITEKELTITDKTDTFGDFDVPFIPPPDVPFTPSIAIGRGGIIGIPPIGMFGGGGGGMGYGRGLGKLGARPERLPSLLETTLQLKNFKFPKFP